MTHRVREFELLVDAMILKSKEVTWDDVHDMAKQNGFDLGAARILIEVMVMDGRLERTNNKYHFPRPRDLDSPWRA